MINRAYQFILGQTVNENLSLKFSTQFTQDKIKPLKICCGLFFIIQL